MELHAPAHRHLVLERTRIAAKCTKNAKKHFSVVNDTQIYDLLVAVVVVIAQVLKTSQMTNESQKWKPKFLEGEVNSGGYIPRHKAKVVVLVFSKLDG